MSKIKYMQTGPFPCFVGYAPSEKDFNAEMKRMNIKDPPRWIGEGAHGTTHVFYRAGKSDCVIICIPRRPKSVSRADHIGLIVHESVHSWQFCKKSMGEKTPGDETEAYFIQAVSSFIIRESGT